MQSTWTEVPNLLNDDGAFLSFLAVLTATEALAGLPQGGSARASGFANS